MPKEPGHLTPPNGEHAALPVCPTPGAEPQITCPRCGLTAPGVRCPRCDAVKLTGCSGDCASCRTKP